MAGRPLGITVIAVVLAVSDVFQVLVGTEALGATNLGLADRQARRLRDRVVAFAWAADPLEPGTRRYRRAAERLRVARPGAA